jgi:hypothetical protein
VLLFPLLALSLRGDRVAASVPRVDESEEL